MNNPSTQLSLPIKTVGEPRLMAKEVAHTVICSTLYRLTRERVASNDVSIFVTACTIQSADQFTRVGHRCILPLQDNTVLSFCPVQPNGDPYDHYVIEVEYTDFGLDPNTLMTRGDFIMELLNVWERMQARISKAGASKMVAELELVMQYTREAYALKELVNPEFLHG